MLLLTHHEVLLLSPKTFCCVSLLFLLGTLCVGLQPLLLDVSFLPIQKLHLLGTILIII